MARRLNRQGRTLTDILIEDDCESIGGAPEMVYPHIREDLKPKNQIHYR